LIIGGSLGSVVVNEAVRSVLPELLKKFEIVHLCGKGKLDETLTAMNGYVQYEYISDELKDLFALSDIVISRAGANSICEFLALKKPALLIPLSAAASRGDQILNANSFAKQGYASVLEEEQLNGDTLLTALSDLWEHRTSYIQAMESSPMGDSIQTITDLIEELVVK
jgi:UDP-N-acetylglucosamine--N-acetylmuramyl-(pentapeptide) pyrophosphoryl-undecaprenol N-acetylglucosamine transferase